MFTTPPIASEPYFALAEPCTISMRSTFSVPKRITSSAAPLNLAKSPNTACPSTKIRVCRASAPRMDTPTRPMESTVRDTPLSVKMISSTDFACFCSISFLVIILTCCELYFASSCALSAVTYTEPSACTVFVYINPGMAIHVAIAQDNIKYFCCFLRCVVMAICSYISKKN